MGANAFPQSSNVLTFEEFKKKPPLFYYLILNVLKLSLPCGQYHERLREAGGLTTHSRSNSRMRASH